MEFLYSLAARASERLLANSYIRAPEAEMILESVAEMERDIQKNKIAPESLSVRIWEFSQSAQACG